MISKENLDRSVQSTRLVQNLEAPQYKEGMLVVPNSSFGGQIDGGFTKQELESLYPVWTFSSMGDACYEFGEVPAAYHRMRHFAENKWLAADVHKAIVFPDSMILRDHPRKKEKQATLYILAEENAIPHIKRVIDYSAVDFAARRAFDRRNKKPPYITLRTLPSLARHVLTGADICGWLDVANGALFTTNYAMFDNAAKHFGVVHDIKPPRNYRQLNNAD